MSANSKLPSMDTHGLSEIEAHDALFQPQPGVKNSSRLSKIRSDLLKKNPKKRDTFMFIFVESLGSIEFLSTKIHDAKSWSTSFWRIKTQQKKTKQPSEPLYTSSSRSWIRSICGFHSQCLQIVFGQSKDQLPKKATRYVQSMNRKWPHLWPCLILTEKDQHRNGSPSRESKTHFC